MATDNTRGPAGRLIRNRLTLVYALSLVIAVLVVTASLVGLLYQTSVYPTDELLESFVPNDAVNLVVGVPILLASMWLARRGALVGLLLWPGALFYVFYTYIVYVLSMPFDVAFLLHLALVALSAYTMIGLVASIDGKTVQRRLSGAVPEKAGGGILAGLAILFFVRAGGSLLSAVISGAPMTTTEVALNATDFLTSPAWIIGGVLLWRRQSLGYVTGLGLLFQATMLFVGLIIILILLPFITGAQFALGDVLVVSLMSLVCVVPFALFVRGVASKSGPPST